MLKNEIGFVNLRNEMANHSKVRNKSLIEKTTDDIKIQFNIVQSRYLHTLVKISSSVHKLQMLQNRPK